MKKEKTPTTNAMRLLEKAHIPFETGTYEYDESDLSGAHAAEVLGIDPDIMFKTLVTRGERMGILVFCIPVCAELDLKKCAASSGDKRVELIHVKELVSLTGYVRGGCSPVGMKQSVSRVYRRQRKKSRADLRQCRHARRSAYSFTRRPRRFYKSKILRSCTVSSRQKERKEK